MPTVCAHTLAMPANLPTYVAASRLRNMATPTIPTVSCGREAGHLGGHFPTTYDHGKPLCDEALVPTVHLQSVGLAPAKAAGDLVPGDVTAWNFGYRSTVSAVRKVGKVSLDVDLVSEKGETHTRRFRAHRLVAIG